MLWCRQRLMQLGKMNKFSVYKLNIPMDSRKFLRQFIQSKSRKGRCAAQG